MRFQDVYVNVFNSAAYAAVQEAADCPGERHNPLIVTGPAGVGKTRLLQAFGDELKLRFPHKTVVRTTAMTFVDDLLQFFRDGTVAPLEAHFHAADCVIIDSCEILLNKTTTFEELMALADDLADDGKQVVLAFSVTAQKLSECGGRRLQESLRPCDGRRGWIVEVQLPSAEERAAFAMLKLREYGMAADDELCSRIAERTRTIAQVVGIVKGLSAHLVLMGTAPSSEMLDSITDHLY